MSNQCQTSCSVNTKVYSDPEANTGLKTCVNTSGVTPESTKPELTSELVTSGAKPVCV